MLFWTAAAAMTLGALLLLLLPLLRNRGGAADDRAAYDLEVYRDQMDELERDVSRNLITSAQADAAKTEIGRRMLATAHNAAGHHSGGQNSKSGEHPKPVSSGSLMLTRILAALMIIGVPLGTLAMYGSVGRPDAPAQPLASRNLDAERGGPSADMLAALEKLRSGLEANPDDPQGWTILGQAYARMGRLSEGAAALRKAVELAPDSVEVLGAYGEVLVSNNGGTVPAPAVEVFDRILTLEPREPRARFFTGLARQQAGDRQGALERWRSLIAESPADAPWVPVVRSHLTQLAQDLKLDPAQIIPQPLPPSTAGAGNEGGSPDADNQMATDQMVRGMVDQLITKLEANPDDVRGWMMLARSHGVLGEPDKAIAAAARAVALAPERADVQIAYASAQLAGMAGAGAASAMPDRPMPDAAVAALKKALEIEPANTEALWLLGLDAANRSDRDTATALWSRLMEQFKPDSPEYAVLRERIDGLKKGG